MVRHAADSINLTPKVLCDAIDIGVEFSLVFDGDGFLASIGAEDDVVV